MQKNKLHPRAALGQIHVYTGDGKGKTTAALGLSIRAAGQGKRIAIVYFDKGGLLYGERNILPKLKPHINFWVTGLVRFVPGKPFRFGVTAGDKQEVLKGIDIVYSLFKKKYDLIIMDEICSCMALKMVPAAHVLRLLKLKPRYTELVMTGRNCPKRILDAADLVTEMKLIKHYFYKGVPARQGIEF
ncbi:MAG: cob(I)yrinic acid a,c-diamide adenosyltransferase [Patescibacteria group bacterium]